MKEHSENYQALIDAKVVTARVSGWKISPDDLHESLFQHQRDIVVWNIHGGNRAVFASFGLGKTRINIETNRQVLKKKGGKALFIAPLGVRQEFTKKEGPAMGVEIVYCKNMDEVKSCGSDYIITNYERIRSGDIDPNYFSVASLDEASVLRSTGSDTFEAFMTSFSPEVSKFVYTATPSPNRFIELINYAHFLGVMDRGQALTRFFKRDSKNAGNLTIHPHKEREFWFWVCSWAVMIYRPSDLGYSDKGYNLPEMKVFWHEIPADHSKAWDKSDETGQRFLLQHEAMGIVASSQEKRETIFPRLAKAKEIVSEFGQNSNWLMWHHLEGERAAIEKAFPESISVYGNLDLEIREQRVIDFSDGKIKMLNTKPELSGSGCNFQAHCHQNLFLGINYDFNDFIQAIHRTMRFGQERAVEVHIIHTEIERSVVVAMKKKWAQHNKLQENMRQIVAEHGLNNMTMIKQLQRTSVVERKEKKGKMWTFINNDCVLETREMEENSVGLVVTSIPFSNHYEYTPSYLDFGHTDNDNHFFAQMDYLIPELLRAVQPGRICCVHVKDRIFYGSQTGTGFSTSNPFHAKTTFAFMQHGWEYMGMAIIPTDVVAENNQTYRLTYGEMRKDSTKMGFGSPEFLLVFRKPQTNKGKAYADIPVVKSQSDYSLGRWQIDADAIWRSSGDRLMEIEKLLESVKTKKDLSKFKKEFANFFNNLGYNYEEHVQIAEGLEAKGKLPKLFSLVTPPLNEEQKDYIWDDVIRMNTLNMNQALKKREQHVCPLQKDVVERCISRYSNPGDVVFDPFGGIGTVPYMAVKMNRYGIGTELNEQYWKDGCSYLKEVEFKKDVPTLFDMLNL